MPRRLRSGELPRAGAERGVTCGNPQDTRGPAPRGSLAVAPGQGRHEGRAVREGASAFLPLPAQECAARRITYAGARSLSPVCFDSNRYRVPVMYAHRSMTVVASVDDVQMLVEDRLIARHRRHSGREHFLFDSIHYLTLLDRQPGGFDDVRPPAD